VVLRTNLIVCNLRSNETPRRTVAGIFVLINQLARKAYVASEASCERAGQLRRYIDSIPTPDHVPYSPILLSSWRYARPSVVNNGGELRIEIYSTCLEALWVGGSRRDAMPCSRVYLVQGLRPGTGEDEDVVAPGVRTYFTEAALRRGSKSRRRPLREIRLLLRPPRP
jgi:hypothetical protein